MNDEARAALQAVLAAWHAEDRNMERKEPGYLEKVRRALAGAERSAHAYDSSSSLVAELAREREKSRALLAALKGLLEGRRCAYKAPEVADEACGHCAVCEARAAIAKAEAEDL